MKHTLTLCKSVRWMQEWTLSPKGVNMKKKIIKIKQVSETDAEKRLEDGVSMKTIIYSSNNSGGSFWLKDEDWKDER